jgi:transposase
MAEGLNRLATILKHRARGYRTLEAFSDRIHLAVVDLDLPAQIPAQFPIL